MEAQVSLKDDFVHYQGYNIDIFVGNIFNLSSNQLGSVDGIYDRAALVALPADLRQQYAAHLIRITVPLPNY